jgi:poly-gamma-glutamate synthesis protein (capsule biosynthesis protein)
MARRHVRFGAAFAAAAIAWLSLYAATLDTSAGDGAAAGRAGPTATAPTTRSPATSAPATSAPTTSGTPTTTAPPPTTADPTPRSFTITASGDLLVHDVVYEQAAAYGADAGTYDFGPMFEGVAPLIAEADLAICHLETLLSRDNARLSGYPQFLVPFQLADAIAAAGYDACSVASNHALDHGVDAMASTLDHLDRVGVRHAGGARSAAEDATPTVLTVTSDDGRPVAVGHLSYAYGFNGFPIPAAAPWVVDRIDADEILRDAAAARAAGAEVVVLSLHWGLEKQQAPTAEQSALARTLLASKDVDVILGHHAHVVQPVERIGGEVVVYGMGNFLSNQHQQPLTKDGVLVHLDVRERVGGGWDVAVGATPTYVEPPAFRIEVTGPDAHPDSQQRTLEVLRSLDPAVLAWAGGRG